jgi:hypothetical protein
VRTTPHSGRTRSRVLRRSRTGALGADSCRPRTRATRRAVGHGSRVRAPRWPVLALVYELPPSSLEVSKNGDIQPESVSYRPRCRVCQSVRRASRAAQKRSPR